MNDNHDTQQWQMEFALELRSQPLSYNATDALELAHEYSELGAMGYTPQQAIMEMGFEL